MNRVWTVIGVVALANLLAIGGFLGWLRASDRLNMERAKAVREMFVRTVAQDKAEAEKLVREGKEKEAASLAAAKATRLPLTASEQLAAKVEVTEIDRQRIVALRAEVESLQAQLAKEREALAAERAALEAERAAYRAEAKRNDELAGSEQFKRTLSVLQSLKPTEAKAALKEMMSAGASRAPNGTPAAPGRGEPAPAGGGISTVVGYLNAMDDRQRGKVMSEFLKDDPRLAAELLERLRTLGLSAQASGAARP